MTYNNNGQNSYKQNTAPSVYSKYSCTSEDDKLLSYYFWNKLFCINIKQLERDRSGKIVNTNNQNNDLAQIFISPTKARMLSEILKISLSGNKPNYDTIRSNQTYLQVVNENDRLGFIIFQVTDNGGYDNCKFMFPGSPEVYNTDRSGFTEVEGNDYIFVEEMVTMLDEYVKASTFAVASTLVSATNYQQRKMQDTLNALASKAGIQTTGRSSGNSGRIFNGGQVNNQYTSGSPYNSDYDD